MSNILSDKSWEEFFKAHPELHGETTSSKELIKALLKERYAAYFNFLPHGVDDFIRGINVLPFSFESIRREAQKFKENHAYFKVDKTQGKLFQRADAEQSRKRIQEMREIIK
jgi:hypothetical protein